MRARAVALFVAVLPGVLGPAAAVSATRDAPSPVRAALIVAAERLTPGASVTLGVHLKLDRGWHVYWVNPGDSGLPTRVQFTAPEGFALGPLQWPLPKSFTQPGEIQGFGYEDEVLLWSSLAAPAEVRAREVTFGAEVSWLACNERCIPGRARLERKVPVGDRLVPGQQDLLRAWFARAPAAAGDAAVGVEMQRRAGGRFEIQVKIRDSSPQAIEFFPGADPALEVRNTVATPAPGGGRIVFDLHILAGQKPASDKYPCLVVWTDPDGQRRGAWVVVPIN